MLSFAIIWDFVKVAIIPIIGVLFSIFYQKFKRYDADIERLKDENRKLNETMVRLDANAVTKKEIEAIIQHLEQSIDKTISLNLKPLEQTIERYFSKKD